MKERKIESANTSNIYFGIPQMSVFDGEFVKKSMVLLDGTDLTYKKKVGTNKWFARLS